MSIDRRLSSRRACNFVLNVHEDGVASACAVSDLSETGLKLTRLAPERETRTNEIELEFSLPNWGSTWRVRGRRVRSTAPRTFGVALDMTDAKAAAALRLLAACSPRAAA